MKFAWLCSHECHQPEVLFDYAIEAEHAGFDAVFASDRFQPWVDDEAASGHLWSWLGAVAARTTTIELASSVTCPLFRVHPAVIAQAAATLDRLSSGRFRLGIGTGDRINDAPLGWQRIGRRERLARLGDALALMRSLWAGNKVSHIGRWYALDGARLYSPPVHPLRVWLAADGPRAAGRSRDFTGTE